MRKRRAPLSSKEQELYDVRMITWQLKKKYFKDLVDVGEKPKNYKIWYKYSKKDIKNMCDELEKELGLK